MIQQGTIIKVSVCVVTYNQEKYIRQCLQSIVDQETDFVFEVIVGDDCSTDRTRAIVQEFAERYPRIIRLIFHEKNVGPFKNYCAVHLLARGEYVAHCDGDDYYLPLKLSTQASFLDNNPTCVMAAHRVKILDGNYFCSVSQRNPVLIGVDYLLLNHPCFVHSSIMYRRNASSFIKYIDYDMVDFFIYINFIKIGNIGFINNLLGVYRKSIGISANLNLIRLVNEALCFAETIFDPNKKLIIDVARSRQFRSYGLNFLLQKDIARFKYYANQAYLYDPDKFINKFIYAIQGYPWVLFFCFLLYKKFKTFFDRIRIYL